MQPWTQAFINGFHARVVHSSNNFQGIVYTGKMGECMHAGMQTCIAVKTRQFFSNLINCSGSGHLITQRP